MNYVVFGLGLLLAAAGFVSIYAGYDIIQVERGWTEVIAGTTAVSGGVVTMSLGIILGRLQSLARLYMAALPAAPVQRLEAEPQLAAASIETRPLTASFAAPSISASPVTASSIAPVAVSPIAPSPLAASILATPPAPDSIAPAEAQPRVAAPLFPKPNLAPVSKPSFFSAAREPLKPSDQISMPADEAPDQVPGEPVTSLPNEDTVSTLAAAEALPKEPAISLPRSPASLALDEMWKRVSDEIEKPIFPLRPKVATQSQTEEIKSGEAPANHASPSAALSATAPAASDFDETMPSIAEEMASLVSETSAAPHHASDEHDGFHHQLADAPGARHPGETHEPSAPAAATTGQPDELTYDDDFGFDDPPPANRFDAAWSTGVSSHSTHAAIEKPPLDFNPAPEPTVIGRYEAEGTAYLMFSDGSIEAQSEAGVFHFASMAELKAFIENKQAAEP